MIPASPLQWPPGKARTELRKSARFGTKNFDGWGNKQLTIHQAIDRVFKEISAYTRHGHAWRINPEDVVINSDLRIKKDGLPYSNQRDPTDPGVAVYFELDGDKQCIAIDTYDRIADNIAAVAHVLSSLRALERHGGDVMKQAFTGFAALPDLGKRTWRDILGHDLTTAEDVKRRFRKLAASNHPDKGGSTEQMSDLNRARKEALEEIG